VNIFNSMYENVELPDNSFDLIAAIDIIEHLYNPKYFFLFVSRLLKPGGILFIRTPNWNAAREYGGRWEGLHQDAEHVYYFNRSSLDNYLTQVGVFLVEVDYEPISSGFGSTECMPSTLGAQSIIHAIREGIRRLPVFNKVAYRMLYRVRRAKSRKDINNETAHELIAIAKKK